MMDRVVLGLKCVEVDILENEIDIFYVNVSSKSQNCLYDMCAYEIETTCTFD